MIRITGEYYVDHDFSGEDLQDHHFSDCHFYRCNFSHSDLTDSLFEGCHFVENGDLSLDELSGCDFSYATLTSSQFKACNLSLSQFSGSRCFGAEFHACNLKGCDFQRASFSNYISQKHYFCSGAIKESNLSYANLGGLLLEECELTDNRWHGADLRGASLRGANLSGGEFSPEQWGSFDLRGADLTRVELNGLDPRAVALDGVIISHWQQSQLLETLGLIITSD